MTYSCIQKEQSPILCIAEPSKYNKFSTQRFAVLPFQSSRANCTFISVNSELAYSERSEVGTL